MSFEIHTRGGAPFKTNLEAARWTSVSGQYRARAPFAGCGCKFEGLGELGCAKCGCSACKGGGMGSISPSIVQGKKGDKLISVSNFITSAGAFDVTRMVDAMQRVLSNAGYAVKKAPTAKAYPLTWAWVFDAANKVYQANVVGAASGPFVKAMEGLGATVSSSPTAADSNSLPSVGTVIEFADVGLPSAPDLNALLGTLREAKTPAARGSNATNGGQLQIRVYGKPSVSPALKAAGMGLAALIGYYLIEGSGHIGTPGGR